MYVYIYAEERATRYYAKTFEPFQDLAHYIICFEIKNSEINLDLNKICKL